MQTEDLVNGRSRGWSSAMGFLLIVLSVAMMAVAAIAPLIHRGRNPSNWGLHSGCMGAPEAVVGCWRAEFYRLLLES